MATLVPAVTVPSARAAAARCAGRVSFSSSRSTHPGAAFRAAERLLTVDDYATKEIAAALIDGGLRNDEFRELAAAALDGLCADPAVEGVVLDALGAALWSSDAMLGSD